MWDYALGSETGQRADHERLERSLVLTTTTAIDKLLASPPPTHAANTRFRARRRQTQPRTLHATAVPFHFAISLASPHHASRHTVPHGTTPRHTMPRSYCTLDPLSMIPFHCSAVA